MKVLVIDDRKERQKQFLEFDLGNYPMVTNMIEKDYTNIEDKFYNDIFDLDLYNVIIVHRSAFGKKGNLIRDKLKNYCQKHTKALVFFSGGISNPYYDMKNNTLFVSAILIYSNNLKLFLENMQQNDEVNLNLLAYGEKWELNLLLNMLEELNKYIFSNESYYGFVHLDNAINILSIDKIINLKDYKEKRKMDIDDFEKIGLIIKNTIYDKLGVLHAE